MTNFTYYFLTILKISFAKKRDRSIYKKAPELAGKRGAFS
jgi:hypothetical protein